MTQKNFYQSLFKYYILVKHHILRIEIIRDRSCGMSGSSPINHHILRSYIDQGLTPGEIQ